MITTTIGIVGRICSGKSTIAKNLSAHFHIPIISFGAYLTQYSKNNNLLTDRDSLQNLGNRFIKQDSNKFLQSVIAFQPTVPDSMIVEGIRHLSIREELLNISSHSVFVFVEASAHTRYNRYLLREKESDKIVSYDEFLAIDNHEVESEIDLLRDKCQLTIDTNSEPNENFLDQLSLFLPK